MGQKYDFELRITRKEYFALMNICGLAPDAHTLVMTASRQENGDVVLQGSHDDFDALLHDLEEEICYELSPKKNMAALQRICEYITPADDDGDSCYVDA